MAILRFRKNTGSYQFTRMHYVKGVKLTPLSGLELDHGASHGTDPDLEVAGLSVEAEG